MNILTRFTAHSQWYGRPTNGEILRRSQVYRLATDASSSSASAAGADALSGTTSGVEKTWDPNNRVRAIGAGIGILTFVGLLFDTFYRRATKQELQEVKQELREEIREVKQEIREDFNGLNAKFDALMGSILQMGQR